MAGPARDKFMERNSFKEKIIFRFFLFSALALLVWGGISYFTSPLVPVLRERQNTAVNLLVLTHPYMLISYNPSLRKGTIINLSEKESSLSLDKLYKHLKLNTEPYILIPQTKNRKIFWNNFKLNLSTWPRKPYQILDYLYTYFKMRFAKKTLIRTGDFIMLSLELPRLRGVDFTVRETKKTKKPKTKIKPKQKAEKIEEPQDPNLILATKKQAEDDTILVVEVFNASDHNGLASEVTNYLRTLHNAGIFKVDVINYTTAGERLNTTKIIATAKRLEALKKLSKHLGLINKEIHYTEDKNAISEAKIYLGEDFKLPKPANK